MLWYQHFLLSPSVFVHKTLKAIYVYYRHDYHFNVFVCPYYVSSYQYLGVEICPVPLFWPLAYTAACITILETVSIAEPLQNRQHAQNP